tara:strand:- start:46 stop:345 length:300 start_codon:yes stop_codon:yes gene_type:complete
MTVKLTETGTAKEKLTELYQWSANYDSVNNPFCVYLDLIGYSKAHYGENIVKNPDECLGYLEYTMLANCLALFENNSYETIYNIIEKILVVVELPYQYE